MIKIAPSILAADFGNLAQEVRSVESGGADLLHIDVMDGHFVPNLSMGAGVVKALRKASALPLDVHLMISDPARYAGSFVEAGADSITFHVEVQDDARKLIEDIGARGVKVGIALNPNTPAKAIEPYLYMVDMVLVMTVYPGFGGQRYIHEVTQKIHEVRELFGEDMDIQVDGGITVETAEIAAAAGANVLVAGTTIFGQTDRGAIIDELRKAAETAFAVES